jgi:flagellar motor switch/type III secretory pathway protein FliN
VLAFDYPLSKPVDMMVNGKLKYRGEVVATTRKLAFEVGHLVVEE